MDQQGQRGRSPSVGHQQPHIKQSHSPSPNPYQPNEPSIGLGLGLDQTVTSSQPFGEASSADFAAFNNNAFQPSQSFPQEQQNFDPSHNFNLQFKTEGPSPADDSLGFATQAQPSFPNNSFNEGDFPLFQPNSGPSDAFSNPLFDQGLNPQDMNAMATTQTHHSPTPPHLLGPDSAAHQPGSAHHSPSFNQHQFSSPSGHQRNASLGPWGQPQFQGHRRTPSEFSDRSSAAPSPNLVSQDTFDPLDPSHSPMQRPSDPAMYDNLNLNSFTISDGGSHHGRSPSHSPAISPRILPQTLPDMNAGAGFGLAPPVGIYAGQPQYPGLQQQQEAFPTLNQGGESLNPAMVAPAISIEFAPNPNSRQNSFEPPKTAMDMESLTPPERGRPRSRPRAVTDPFNSAGSAGNRANPSSLSPHLGADLQSNSSRSLSPLDRSATSSPSRRRQSTSAVPNNVMALRIANPEYQNSQDNGGAKRAQKHPATFQCTLCPKRFTRAYNLRSHLRTHTDERPFVCTVCGKAFARQHDRKRHEGLHSGEKKFVCKGDLKVGGQWGCGRRFARADALGRHFRSEAGRICIKPLLDEEMLERQRMWQEQRIQQNMAQSMVASQQGGPMALDPTTGYPVDAQGQYALPAALLAQYPALAQMNWNGPDMGGSGMEDELSGRSSFDASDYDEGEDGYVSGPGTGFGEGGMAQNFGEMGYASDYGGR